MCEFCVKHGEGKKRYLNTKNYHKDLLADIRTRRLVTDFFYWAKRKHDIYFPIIKLLPLNMPVVGIPVRNLVRRLFVNDHWGQVIPREDVEKIL
jgi:hypothetical protein